MAAVHQPEFSTASVFPETVAFDIPADLLDQVRDSVLDGFTACGDGGVEVVGVLWGQRGSRRPRVQEFKAITAELSEPRFPPGSAFTLLTRAIEDGERDARFSRLQVLGWFRSASDEAEVVESDITLHKAVSDFAFPFLPGCFVKFQPLLLTKVNGWLIESARDGRLDFQSSQAFLLSALKSGVFPTTRPDRRSDKRPDNSRSPAQPAITAPAIKVGPPVTDTVFRVPDRTPQLRFVHWALIGLGLIMIVMGLRLSHSHQQAQALAIRNADLVGQVGRIDTRNRRLEALVATMRAQCESGGKPAGKKP